MDPIDLRLLRDMRVLGAVGAKSAEQRERLENLSSNGLCYCEQRESPGFGPPAYLYRLSGEGEAYLDLLTAKGD